ncbi:MAG TPA: hypothetical protein VK777_12395 [Reyranella sp.]|nr:hypothetical protein [Reyranella sp.]
MPVSLPDMPKRIARLPKDERGYPAPRFVEWLKDGRRARPTEQDAKPDFRYASAEFRASAFKHGYCWVCGEQLGVHKVYAIGPMCVVNRVTQEPACHRECAEFSVKACPFLLRPRMRRIPLKDGDPRHTVGMMIERNPGCTCLYETNDAKAFAANGGWLIKLGKPTRVDWWCEGRAATRAEIKDSIDSGFPILLDVAMQEGQEAVDELTRLAHEAMQLLPVGPAPCVSPVIPRC